MRDDCARALIVGLTKFVNPIGRLLDIFSDRIQNMFLQHTSKRSDSSQ